MEALLWFLISAFNLKKENYHVSKCIRWVMSLSNPEVKRNWGLHHTGDLLSWSHTTDIYWDNRYNHFYPLNFPDYD